MTTLTYPDIAAALLCQNKASRPPVWMMRQAGRYMPQYRKLKEQYNFWDLVRESELAAQVSLMPIAAFDPDAIIFFSDILLLVEAMGRRVRFEDSLGPVIERPIQTEKDVASLVSPRVFEDLSFITTAFSHIQSASTKPILGLCGGPFTLAAYMIEGHLSRDLHQTRKWMYQNSQAFSSLIDKITQACIDFCHLQLKSGAVTVQIFDSWAGLLPQSLFIEYSLKPMQRIQAAVSSKLPLIYFCRGSTLYASEIAQAGVGAISLDWQLPLDRIRKVAPHAALQGNLDPHLLYAPQHILKKGIYDMLKTIWGDPGYIANLGHGLLPDIPYENVAFFVDTIKNIDSWTN